MPEQPPITASVGEVVGPKPPGHLQTMFKVLIWDTKFHQWSMMDGWWTNAANAEATARNLSSRYSHYRIVTIPGDE